MDCGSLENMNEHTIKQDILDSLVKVAFDLKDTGWKIAFETMWAKDLGSSKYLLMNSPFYAYGYSFQDVVSGDIKEGQIVINGIHRIGGHSTYRIFVRDKDRFHVQWKKLEKLGCTYEQATKSLYAIDVLPEIKIEEVYNLLRQGEQDNVWQFEEGHCEHK